MGRCAYFTAILAISFILTTDAFYTNDPVSHEDFLCAAYFELVEDDVPGLTWSTLICDDRSANSFVECSISDHHLSSTLHFCNGGLFFSYEDVACVNQDLYTQCPIDWDEILYSDYDEIEDAEGLTSEAPELPDAGNMTASFSFADHANEAQHGCIDCEITPCKRCVCRHARKTSAESEHAYINDPERVENDRFLQCHGESVVCHPCSEGLVWDCQSKNCAKTSVCPDIPEECYEDCGIFPPVATVTTVTTTCEEVTTVVETIYKVTNVTSCRTKPHIIDVSVESGETTITETVTKSPVTVAEEVTVVVREGKHPLGTDITVDTKVCVDKTEEKCLDEEREVKVFENQIVIKGPNSEAQHGCIDCVIDECKRCVCQEALATSGKDPAYIPDPRQPGANRFLQCHSKDVVCQPCHKGLVWDCQSETCAPEGTCPDIPKSCFKACGRKPDVITVATHTTKKTTVEKTVTVVKNVTNTTDISVTGSSALTTSDPTAPVETVSVDRGTVKSMKYSTVGDYNVDPHVDVTNDFCSADSSHDCSDVSLSGPDAMNCMHGRR